MNAYVKRNAERSQEIASHLAEFKARGGQVYKAAIGESGYKHQVLSKNRVVKV